VLIAIAAALIVMALGGAAFAFAGDNSAPSQKRVASAGRSQAVARVPRGGADTGAQRRKNVQALLKDIEAKQAEKKKEKITLRRRLEMAGFAGTTPRTFWMISGGIGLVVALICFITGQTMLVMLLASFGAGLGVPRWVLSFLKNRREKAFTAEFANAIDVIVRSVKSGLPTNEALKIVAKEIPDPVGAEFNKLVEGLKVGVSLDQGLKRMFESMPTAEVSFFGIVMTIQQKSGGNLSEALGNLSGVLRDRKRLQGKIKAMSSEAKASAMIIGALPPAVMGITWLTTPAYIDLLFTEKLGNLMLAGCALWMGTGIFVMRKMINFKH
jgi:tight adherence protein B